MLKTSNPLRAAVWLLLAGFGLTLLLALPHPEVARAIAAAGRHFRPGIGGPSAGLQCTTSADARCENVAGASDSGSVSDCPPSAAPSRTSESPTRLRAPKAAAAHPRKARHMSADESSGKGQRTSGHRSGTGTAARVETGRVPRPAVELGSIEEDGSGRLARRSEHPPGHNREAHKKPQRRVIFQAVDGPPAATTDAGFSKVTARLAALERRIEKLAQDDSDRKIEQLERETRLLEQRQRSERLRELERRLNQLQPENAKASNHNSPDNEPAAAKSVLKADPNRSGDDRFSLQIQDADVTEVLEMLGETAGVNILVGKDVEGTVPSANLRNVTVDQALEGILRSLDLAYEREDDFVFVMTEAAHKARQQLSRKIVSKVYRPSYISVSDLQALVVPLLTPEIGSAAVTPPNESGIALDSENAGGDGFAQTDALLVMDYAEVIEQVDALVSEMDVPPLQVVIEAMILSVRLTDSMDFGVNFALLNGQSDHLVVSGNGRTLNNSSGFPGEDDESIVPPMGQFIADAAGLKFGFIRGDISAFIEALENISDTNLIASPQLRVLNKQRAQLIIGDRLSFTTRTFSDNQIIEDVNFIDAGTKLIIRPFISEDGLIRMEVHPERSSARINPQTGLPDLRTTEVTTNVMVRNGATVVIGGLIEEQVEESFDRVPLLGALPVVGHAFRNKSESISRSELIVLITPRIVSDPQAEMEGDALRFESERRADFFRNHLSPINRRNLARMEYERARYFYDQRRYLKARDHIRRSLRHSKNNLEALRLRDLIDQAIGQQKRDWLGLPTPTVWPLDDPLTQGEKGDGPADQPPLPPVPE